MTTDIGNIGSVTQHIAYLPRLNNRPCGPRPSAVSFLDDYTADGRGQVSRVLSRRHVPRNVPA